jgi:drug/metabolite transporter (DMT)-like permease
VTKTPVSRSIILRQAALVVLSNAAGNFALGWGLAHPVIAPLTGLWFVDVLLNPWVLGGVVLLSLWVLWRVSLLGMADLSFVLPVTAAGYLIAPVLGALFLGETVTPLRWLGGLCIVAGAILAGQGTHRSEAAT